MSRAEVALKYFNGQKEFMDSRVNAGIETNRKGFARIDVTDSDGNPIKGLSFKAKQKITISILVAICFCLTNLKARKNTKNIVNYFQKFSTMLWFRFIGKVLSLKEEKNALTSTVPNFTEDLPQT